MKTMMTPKTNLTEEGKQNQEKTTRKKSKIAGSIFSLIRESIGKKKNEWKEEQILKDLGDMYDKIIAKSVFEESKDIFNELEEMTDDKEEKKYINFLKKRMIQTIDDIIGDSIKGIKLHYGYDGADIIDAIIEKKRKKREEGNYDTLRRMYELNSNDFLSYFTEKKRPPINIEDIRKYCSGEKIPMIESFFKDAKITLEEAQKFIEQKETKSKEKNKKDSEQKKNERLLWVQTAMKGIDDEETIKTVFNIMEENLIKHPELAEKKYDLYFKTVEITKDEIKLLEDKKEESIRNTVNKALIKAV